MGNSVFAGDDLEITKELAAPGLGETLEHTRMDPIDREVLALRHFEQMTNAEVAQVLELGESAASSRYLRALKRLKDELKQIPGLFER